MRRARTILAKHLLAGDVLGGRVVESFRYVAGEVLVFYRDGGQTLLPLDAHITVKR